ncbi:hypothetical protein PM082_024242 [Marasmius tenuissimus]|nr:hypothetical protein PM082_024242 [Marasmius tenuissimus]
MSYPNGRQEYSSYNNNNNNYDSYNNHPPSFESNQGYNHGHYSSQQQQQYPSDSYDAAPAPTGEYGQQPHFMGQALYQRPGYAASQHSMGYQQSEYASSVYALNDNRDKAPSDDVPMSPMGGSRNLEEKRAMYDSPKKSKRKVFLVSGLGALVILGVAGFAVYWFAFRKSGSSGGSGKASVAAAVTGADGSKVLLEDGTTMNYTNPHGGYWYYDPNDPFKDAARAQSWTPALNETFKYGVDKIRGVNLGGWLNLEPFISPALFEKYQGTANHAVDEYTLSLAMTADQAGGGLNQIEEHYKTFITEKDFAQIAAAGLNYVRIPIAYWAIEVRDGEPFLPKVSWKYFLKAVEWARKYGIRINLDLHAVPGSQNGWNHSGRLGPNTVSWLHGAMGYANAQRTLDYIRILAEFASQPQYSNVITMFGIINEPRAEFSGKDNLASFYAEAYKIVREASGIGKGPWVSIHDGMLGKDEWIGWLPGADRVTLDAHPYMAFGGQDSDGWAVKTKVPCQWGGEFNRSMEKFGLTNAGEFSWAINDCGLFLNGVDDGVRYDGTYIYENRTRVGSCTQWTDWENYTEATKAELKKFVLGSLDALQNYFFWTWKIGDSLKSGKVETPAWSYKLGLDNGWIPQDPREAAGACGNTSPITAAIPAGTGAVDYAPYPWPPTTINSGGSVRTLPTYTQTGTIPTLTGGPALTYSGVKATKTADWGNGWNNAKDTVGMAVPVSGCNYLDTWAGPSSKPPVPLCSAGVKRDEPEAPMATPPPQ